MVQFSAPVRGNPLAVAVAAPGERVSAIAREGLVAQYKAHGAILLRGFGVDLDQFHALARSLSPVAVVNESPGRAPLDPGRALYSVDGGCDAFSLHPELSREPWKPDLAMFACLSPPGVGGATTLCDGVALVAALPPAVREGLRDRRLVYLSGTWPELLEFWLGTPAPDDGLLANPPRDCPYRFMRLPDGRIIRQFSRPALHRPMFAPGPAFGNFLLFARFNNGRGDFPLLDDLTPVPEAWLQAIRVTAEGLTLAVEWQQGDVLILDNTRFMHGRTAVVDPVQRQIATYFGYVDFRVPDAEEPADPIWLRADFEPPRPPAYLLRR